MYKYSKQKQYVFLEEGQKTFLQIRDRVKQLLQKGGAFRLQEAIASFGNNSWDAMACVDRLVELGEIREITKDIATLGQYRVFVGTGI